MQPYIGITDFTSFSQVERMQDVFARHRKTKSERMLHVGVMMSYKTLHGIPTKWSSVFPAKETIRGIFASDEAYNCLHYADYDRNPDLWRDLVEAISYGGILIRALQLDMVWPEPADIANAVHTSRKYLEVILQINSVALDDVDNDPGRLVERLEEYQHVIHRVLLDKSMGRGLGLDAAALLPFARAIQNAYPELGLGIAGGLGPDSLNLIAPLHAEFPNVSIDAQGRLRHSGSALDPIDWNLAERYLINALHLVH
jgi:hypothetical protein